eukprot:3408_1
MADIALEDVRDTNKVTDSIMDLSHVTDTFLLCNLSMDKREILAIGYVRELKLVPNHIIKLIIDFYGLIRSNLKSLDNPRTVNRLKLVEMKHGPTVHFHEEVIVHSVPYFDPSRLYGDWAADKEPAVKFNCPWYTLCCYRRCNCCCC